MKILLRALRFAARLWWVDVETALLDLVDTQRRPARRARARLRYPDLSKTYRQRSWIDWYVPPECFPEAPEVSRLRKCKHVRKGDDGGHLITFHTGEGAQHRKVGR
jgi:hypothetical protein